MAPRIAVAGDWQWCRLMIFSEIIPEKHRSPYCAADTTRTHHAAMANIDDDTELLPISLDGVTVARLCRLARACGDHPAKIAASLLHDLLADDEAANVIAVIDRGQLN